MGFIVLVFILIKGVRFCLKKKNRVDFVLGDLLLVWFVSSFFILVVSFDSCGDVIYLG